MLRGELKDPPSGFQVFPAHIAYIVETVVIRKPERPLDDPP
jgi:hypothetical protein